MPRLNAIVLITALVSSCGVSSHAQNASPSKTRVASDLFSGITMSDVVPERQKMDSDESKRNSAEILGPLSLSKFLNKNSINHDVTAGILSIGKDQSEYSVRFQLSVDAESKRIKVQVPAKTKASNDDRLRKLLIAVSKLPQVYLIADGDQLALQTWISNQDVTNEKLQTALKRLSDASAETQTLASPTAVASTTSATKSEKASTLTNAKNAKATSKGNPPATPTRLSADLLVGTWSAKTSTSDAWAVRFGRTGTYTLVHTRNGKNAISKGSYNVSDNRLTLQESTLQKSSLQESKGTTLTGTVTSHSTTQFSWGLQNGQGQTTTTLQFKSTES